MLIILCACIIYKKNLFCKQKIIYHIFIYYLQFTKILVCTSYFCRAPRALLVTVHLYKDESSFFVGMIVNMDLVGSSLFLPGIRFASRCLDCPSIYQYIWGGGEPPVDAQVRFNGLPSVAVGSDGAIVGGWGFSSTVNSTDLECSSIPDPPSFIRHSNWPLSRSYVALLILRSYMPFSGWCSTL